MKVYKNEKAKQNILSTYEALIKEWNVPITQVDIPSRYGTTHVNVCGKSDGIPIILFHGVGDDSALMWIYNAEDLASHFKLYAIDTIGGPGKSTPGPSYNKSFDDVIWIDEVLDYFMLNRVNIVGVSHGGYLAQLYCLMRPHRVAKAVCMASSVASGKNGGHLKTMLKIFFPEALFPTKRNTIKLLKKLTGENSAAFTDNPLILEHFTYLLRGFNNMAMKHHKVDIFTEDQISAIRDKCLYLVGEADPFAIMGGKAALEKYYMNARFFAGVGHGINHEIPGKINQILIEFFTVMRG